MTRQKPADGDDQLLVTSQSSPLQPSLDMARRQFRIGTTNHTRLDPNWLILQTATMIFLSDGCFSPDVASGSLDFQNSQASPFVTSSFYENLDLFKTSTNLLGRELEIKCLPQADRASAPESRP